MKEGKEYEKNRKDLLNMKRYSIKNPSDVGKARMNTIAGDLKLNKKRDNNDFLALKERADKYKKWEKRNG